jgi:hypothetical protein
MKPTKVEIGNSGKFKNPKVRRGWSLWIENGVWFKARTVDKRRFGGHDYDNGGFEQGIRKCKCGCFMGGWSSDGPVDPFGPCPLNPRKPNSVHSA